MPDRDLAAPLSLPRAAVLAYRQSGGLRFSTREAIVYENGRLTWEYQGKLDVGSGARQLTRAEVAELKALLERSGLAELPSSIGSPSPDGYAYELIARVGSQTPAREFFTGHLPPNVQSLIQRLKTLSATEPLGNKDAALRCPECGADGNDGQTCEERFHQMLFWEAEFPAYGEVHHLTVLCYHLQHPHLYSPDGLKEARRLLMEFVERGVAPDEVRKINRAQVDSSQRKWKIAATPDAQGSYAQPIAWPLTTADVIAGGPDHYCDNVRAWARSINEILKAQP